MFANVNSEVYTYTYNADGIRTAKTMLDTGGGLIGSSEYIYDGTKLIAENRDGEWLYYFYDADGTVTGMSYNNVLYYFRKNLQGDVTGIYNAYGNIIAQYEYTPYGALFTVTDANGVDVSNDATHIANVNPFRYRGYYYDTETGFYYLQSRYYDPVVGRFLNADNKMSEVGGEIIGSNQFSYCFNNPVNLVDNDGDWPKLFKNAVKWIAKKAVKPVVDIVEKTVSKIDMTYSTGVSLSGTPGAWVFNGQIGASIDTEGNVAIQVSSGGGVTTGNAGGALTVYGSVTNAPNIDKLEGEYYQAGGSVGAIIEGVPLSAGADVMLMPDNELDTQYYGVTGNFGLGSPGQEVHIEWGSTSTINSTKFNVFDEIQDVYIIIMRW